MAEEPARPPFWLSSALFACVGAGCVGVMHGVRDLRTLWGANLVPAAHGPEAWWADVARAQMDVLLAHARTEFPLAVANLLLSLVLLFASWRTLSRTPGARRFLVQALVANALLSVVTFGVTSEARNQVAMAFADHMPRWAKATGDPVEWEDVARTIRFLQRAGLVFALAAYGALLFAMTGESARAALPAAPGADDAGE